MDVDSTLSNFISAIQSAQLAAKSAVKAQADHRDVGDRLAEFKLKLGAAENALARLIAVSASDDRFPNDHRYAACVAVLTDVRRAVEAGTSDVALSALQEARRRIDAL